MELELLAWHFLSVIADYHLQSYPTTFEHDDVLLQNDIKNNELGVNKRNCLLQRMSEKGVYHFLKDCASKVGKLSRSLDLEDAKL